MSGTHSDSGHEGNIRPQVSAGKRRPGDTQQETRVCQVLPGAAERREGLGPALGPRHCVTPAKSMPEKHSQNLMFWQQRS